MAGRQYHRFNSGRCLKYLIVLAVLASLVYLINRWLILPQANCPAFFHEYLGDMLALPVYLPLSLFLAVKLKIMPPDLHLGIVHIVGSVVLFSIIFEGIMPFFDRSSTRDIWDILAYATGGSLVYGTQVICQFRGRSL